MGPTFSAPCQPYDQNASMVVKVVGQQKLHLSIWGLCDAAAMLSVMYPCKSVWSKPAESCECDWQPEPETHYWGLETGKYFAYKNNNF